MNHFGADYLAARFSVWDWGRARLSRLGGLHPVAGYRDRRQRRRALRDLERLDAHLRADIGFVPDGLHPPVEDIVPMPAAVTHEASTAANDNSAERAA